MDRRHASQSSSSSNNPGSSAPTVHNNSLRAPVANPDEPLDTRKRVRTSTSPEDVSRPSTPAGAAIEPFSQMSLGFRDDLPSPTKRQRTLTDGEIPAATILPIQDESTVNSRNLTHAPMRPTSLPPPSESESSPNPCPCDTSIQRRAGIFNALLAYEDLVLEVTRHLDVDELVTLYSISKEFQILANRHFTALILTQSVSKAPESSRTFLFRNYLSLCIRDPAQRPLEVRPAEARWVPSFRWLRMVLFREQVVDDIVECMYQEGHRLPRRASLIIKKLWYTLDISDNVRRIGVFHDESFWSAKDLFTAKMFVLKLDMHLTHPMRGNGETGLRRMLLNQRSFSVLARVLKREEMITQLDMLTMIVRYNYIPTRPPTENICGVPPQDVGRLQWEGWGKSEIPFIPIDELISREAIRRNLKLQNYYIDMMIYGYINKQTWEDNLRPEQRAERERLARTNRVEEEEDS
ncbi:MAG: hypothetical protein OHK93_003960 [Ramalina farinacea]|uniref:F-box domain-containing protein n=1 Tax=Ramalina farinacea TaxID=258253 RepID=A0AA43QJ07_9LECA|nr:hypothetical protein [Ramalina farinacea]